MQLLFCNTFSSDAQTGPSGSWAVVKFPCMIAVDEIRIVPPGVKVHSQLHEDQFIGRTSPSKFRIEFFSDDRSASMTTYEHVGYLEYVEGSPNRFHPSSALYSEKLLLRGWFTHITVAVYGGILSEVGGSTASPSLDINIKTPSLIIHGKPEGRSVYIRGMPDVPQLTKEVEEPVPLLDQIPAVSNPDFMLGRGVKNYSDLDDVVGRRQLEDLRLQDMENPPDEVGGNYYDRRQQRDRGFGEMGRPRKNYLGDRMDYPVHPRNIGGRKTLLPDIGSGNPYRSEFDERQPYNKDKSRGFSHQRSHQRHETVDNSDLSKRNYKDRNERSSYDSHTSEKKDEDPTSGFQEQDELVDLRQNLNQTSRAEMEMEGREKQQDWMVGEYEEISDEEIEEERVAALQAAAALEDMEGAELLSPTSMMCFNPFLMQPMQLLHFNHPEMTEFEISCSALLSQQQEFQKTEELPQVDQETDVAKLENLIDKGNKIIPLDLIANLNYDGTTSVDKIKEWVSTLEEVVPLITRALPTVVMNAREKYNKYMPTLITWIFAGLDSTMTASQAIGTNLRMLKCGINLAHRLCQTTQEIVTCLTDVKLDEKLLALLTTNNMASSVKIMVIHALDAYLSWPSSLSAYFNMDSHESNDIFVSQNYARLVELLLVPQAARVATALSRIVNKIKLFHSMLKLKIVAQTLVVLKIPNAQDDYEYDDEYMMDDADSDVVEEEIVLEEEEMMIMSSTSNDEDEDVPAIPELSHKDPDYARKPEKQRPELGNREQHMDKFSDNEPTPAGTPPSLTAEDAAVPLDAAICVSDATLSQSDVAEIVEYLTLFTNTLENIKSTITQLPKRTFPTSLNLNEVSDKEAKSTFFRLLEFYRVLPSIQALLSLPVVSGVQEIYEAAYTFLDILMSSQDGLLYISSNWKSVICTAKHLLCSAPLFSTAEVETPGTAAHLGAKLAFHLQAMQCIDQLHTLPEQADLVNSEESIEVLKVLYSLTYPTFGKYWLSKVLSLEDNILPLLKCISLTKEEKPIQPPLRDKDAKSEIENKEKVEKTENPQDTKKKSTRKSASSGFSLNILLGMLKISPNVGFLLSHAKTLRVLMKNPVTSRSAEEVNEWLRPLESLSAEKDGIIQLMEFLKGGFEKLEWNTLMTSGPGLCTALRLLCHLTGAENPYSYNHASNISKKTKPSSYCTVLQVFSGGGLSLFLMAIEQLNKCFVYPCFSQHSLTTVFSFNFQNLVSAISESLLILIDHLLKVLLGTTEGKFQPEQLTRALVNLYSGMYPVLWETDEVRLNVLTELIVSVFSLFIVKSSETEALEVESDDWTKVLNGIIASMQEHCQSLVPGLILLSHLLPLPLPLIIEDAETLDEASIKAMLSYRKAWEVRLTSVMERLTSLIEVLSYSNCLPLQGALVTFVQQMVDLSPNIATSITSMILSACITEGKPRDPSVTKDATTEQSEVVECRCHAQPVKVLSEVAHQPSAKATLLRLIDKDEKDPLNHFWETALSHIGKDPNLLNSAIKLANVLLDPEIKFIPDKDTDTLPESHVSHIVQMAVEGLESPSLSTVSSCLYCLSLACVTERGFLQVRTILVKQSSALCDMLGRTVHSWDIDDVFAVELTYEFCSLINELSNPRKGRPSFLSKAEIKSVLKWNKEFESHPLLTLKSELEKTDLTDEFCNQTLDEVTAICQTLKTSVTPTKTAEPRKDKTDDDSPGEINPIPLAEQFKQRPLWAYGDDDYIFNARLEMLCGSAGYTAEQKDMPKDDCVKTDLLDMAAKFCTGFNLENSLKELTESAKTTDIDKIRMEAKAKRLKKLETFSTWHGKTQTYIKRSHILIGVNPRGRGRGRGGPPLGRHYDLFRQRKQNTSRPPSMHVDDFVAADQEDKDFPAPPPPPPLPFVASRRTSRPFKRDFIPRGRGGRGTSRSPGIGRGGFSSFEGSESSSNSPTGFDKFRNKNVGSRSQDRFPRGRGRGRDPNRTSFSPRDSFKGKPQQSWSFSPRNFGFASTGGFRGGRGNKIMRIGRGLLPPPPLNLAKWGMPPPPRRGRGYGKPRGKHTRSFTR